MSLPATASVSIRVCRWEEEEEEESERLGAFASTENDAERVGQIPPSGGFGN